MFLILLNPCRLLTVCFTFINWNVPQTNLIIAGKMCGSQALGNQQCHECGILRPTPQSDDTVLYNSQEFSGFRLFDLRRWLGQVIVIWCWTGCVNFLCLNSLIRKRMPVSLGRSENFLTL